MLKVKERWKIMNEIYDSLTESEFEEIRRKNKVTIEEVKRWASEVKELKISGGIKRRGWSEHDIDFWIDLPTNRPWDCPCRNLLKTLPEPKFKLPINGWCGGCGASIVWNNNDNRWEWYWDHTKYEFAKGIFREGISEDDIEEMRERVDNLERERNAGNK